MRPGVDDVYAEECQAQELWCYGQRFSYEYFPLPGGDSMELCHRFWNDEDIRAEIERVRSDWSGEGKKK